MRIRFARLACLLLTCGAVAVAAPVCAQVGGTWHATDPIGQMTAPVQVGEYVTEVYRDRRGTLWMGTLTEGLCRHDSQGFRCLGEQDGYSGGALRAVAEDSQGTLWFGGQQGLLRFDGKRFTPVGPQEGLPATRIWSLLLDRHGRLWVGSEEGVFRQDGERFEPFEIPLPALPDAAPRFSTKLAFAIVEDRRGRIWFGTDGAGAIRYDGKEFTRYTRADGLASNDITAMAEDGDGGLWFTSRTGGGLARFDGTRFRRYTGADGLPSETAWAAIRDRHGRMWFGTAGGGLVHFDGERFVAYTDDSGLTRNHVQSIFADPDGLLWAGFSGGLFRLDPRAAPGMPARLVNVSRAGPWDAP